jgi:hypothetical protein
MTTLIAMLDARVSWAETQEPKPLWPNGPTPKEYVEGFARKTGSYVERLEDMRDLRELFAVVDRNGTLKDVTEELDSVLVEAGHRYYTAEVPDGFHAWENIILIEDLTDEELPLIRLERGPHGIEADGSLLPPNRLEPHRTYTLAFIEDADGLVTWYPGRFSAKAMKELVAVKGKQ